jgi:hypothetical protein
MESDHSMQDVGRQFPIPYLVEQRVANRDRRSRQESANPLPGKNAACVHRVG